MMSFLRARIVSAAPTCTLWLYDFHRNVFVFKFNQAWVITRRELEDTQ